MAARQQGGQFRGQDGHVLTVPGQNRKPHAQWRWEQRADGEWADESVRVIWRVSERVDYPRDGYARYHEPSDIVLLARYGVLKTAIDLSTEPEHIQEYVREQVGFEDGGSE